MSKENRSQSELSKYEWEMLQEYIDINNKKDITYYYSVRVGGGANTEAIKEIWLRKLIRHNTRLKIDCLAINKNFDREIIEVKKVAKPGALGQLMCYKYLYDKEYGTNAKMTLLCRFANTTILQLCDYFHIKVETLGTYN